MRNTTKGPGTEGGPETALEQSLPGIVERFNRVERDWFSVDLTNAILEEAARRPVHPGQLRRDSRLLARQ